MKHIELKQGRTFMGYASEGEDLLSALTKFVKDKKIQAGYFNVIGAVKSAVIGFYDEHSQSYKKVTLNQELEISGCLGNISIKDEEEFIHAHIILGNEEGKTYSGHLFEGTPVLLAEFNVQELTGEKLVRKFNEASGLFMWDI